ncbi:hypothetical protein GXM_05760 [Nostoc sphaeroides CCNUC1]|uniref:Uncharacterized protein n=1 Tax=Nostoc sphaeroides CCNUC1 TaxID=2653204 RepID=A0A5P8W6B6_9NOSO|nr:hypothetical protein GXM_05760 [Nostoc sphaeroides CCNUC1]
MTVQEFSVNSQQSTVNSQQSTTLMWNNLFFGVPRGLTQVDFPTTWTSLKKQISSKLKKN